MFLKNFVQAKINCISAQLHDVRIVNHGSLIELKPYQSTVINLQALEHFKDLHCIYM